MERFRLLALILVSFAATGCVGLFRAAPAGLSTFNYSMGQGRIVFQLPLIVVVEEVDRTLTEAGFHVTFRHVDRHGAVVKAKSKDGKSVEATLKVEGMLTQLSMKVGRWGDREKTESLIGSVSKGVRSPALAANPLTDVPMEAKKKSVAAPVKGKKPSPPADEEPESKSDDEPPN